MGKCIYALGVELDSQIVTAAYGATTLLEYESKVLAAVARALRVEVALIVRENGLGLGAYGVRPEIAKACRSHWPLYGEELSPVFEAARRANGVAVDVEVLGASFPRTRLFREFIGPHGGCSTLIASLDLGPDRLAKIALGRVKGGFSDAERDRVSALLPALSVCEAALNRRSAAVTLLSEREREVVRVLRLGYTNAEIAASLGTSVNTVRNQLRSIFEKLGATTRAEVVALSLGHGA